MTVLWNTADKTANITLSGGSLVATKTTAPYGGVRADTSAAAGQIYCEYTVLSTIANNTCVGWANATASLSVLLGTDQNAASWIYSFGQVWKNNGTIASVEIPGVAFSTLCVAFDIGALKLWVRVNNSLWNASATADPGSGTGGISLASMNAGPYFPVFNSNVNGASVLANFGATSFAYAVPSGFSGLDTNAQAYNASSKFLGYGALPPAQDSVAASKLLGYAPLPPSQNAAVSSKFIAYAILATASGKSRVYFLD